MAAYYNEFDPQAAAWLRELIAKGHIAPGLVDERSIEDVKPDDLKEFTQCHFFAGIGVWSYALRRAGWDDSRPVWTASCPCQPFSAAGAGAGFADARHLWPSLAWLIAECQPSVVIGEQVASKAVEPWVDLVHADLEALGYAFGAVPFPSAGVGAPHIRDRLYWVADSESDRHEWSGKFSQSPGRDGSPHNCATGNMAYPSGDRCNQGRECQPTTGNDGAERDSAASGMGDTNSNRSHRAQRTSAESSSDRPNRWVSIGGGGDSLPGRATGPTNGMWADADWLFCRDGKWRPVEPGTFPLVNGASARVVRLRGYGNAINAEAAKIFIEAVMGV